ncbi:hypothetical protein [Deinococcus sp. Leaf326]|uniref:hypothetical protein n=1 Tax=Deinococcus sp. Leaf326 TaxID=1736338 RepID=UPI0006F883D6|nr:hypothetical protein [Deinococcus sp. Leaf326]KQR37762.1 hypothetical protein ASF71_14875 [Deinococcus sp. Leaf326]
MLRIEVTMTTRTPMYRQQAPAGLHTHDELEAMGLRPRPGELPRGVLKVRDGCDERMTGVFGLDQAEPIVGRAVSA